MALEDNSAQAKERLKQASMKWLKASALLVEGSAITLSPVGKTGELRDGNDHVIDEGALEAKVGNRAFHSVFVEKGTGEFATEGGGRRGYWVYVKGQPPGPGGKTHTLKTAQQAVVYLRSKGLEAYYTNGMPPKPFLLPAFRKNKSRIQKLAKKYYKEVSG